MEAVAGSLCWKKHWQHLEGARGHRHTHGGLHPAPKNAPKASLEPVRAGHGGAALRWGAKERGCSPSPGTFLADVPLIPFLAPSQSH